MRLIKLVILLILILYPVSITEAAFKSGPSAGAIKPYAGRFKQNETVEFTTIYTDLDGWKDIKHAYLLINTSTSGTYCFYAYYNQAANKLYLRDDSNLSWLGGCTPGSSDIIENTYTRLNCSSTKVSGSDITLTIRWNITFKPAFTGQKNIYVKVKDAKNITYGWIQKGTLAINNTIPSAGTISPSLGHSNPGETVLFTAVYTDLDG